MSTEKILQRILANRRDLTRKEVASAIEEKRAASEGFLTDEASARLIAAELGVEISHKGQLPKILIKHLIAGLNDVTVSGRVLLVNKPKVFSRFDGKGKVARLQIADRTGSIGVVMWDNKAELVDEIHLRELVRVKHAYVRRSNRRELEIHVGERGSIQIQPPDLNEEDYPTIENFLTKIHEIETESKYINVEGTVGRKYPISTFQRKDGTQGKIKRVVLEDETDHIPVVFWNEKAEEVARIKEGDTVLLMNTKVRENRQGGRWELHLDNSSTIEITPKEEDGLNIKDLKEGMRITFLEGTIIAKPVFKKVTTKRGEEISLAIFRLKDETGEIQVSAWREQAKKVEKLTVDTKVKLKNIYAKKGYNRLLEISTTASTEIDIWQ